MSYWGRVVGASLGWLTLGPLGLLLGFLVGGFFDRGFNLNSLSGGFNFNQAGVAQTQQTYFQTTFEVMGHVAKSDGRISPQEIRAAESIMKKMRLNAQQRKRAIQYFSTGKNQDFNLSMALQRLKEACSRRRMLLQMFVEIQFQAAMADGQIGPNKQRILQTICQQLGVTPMHVRFADLFGAAAQAGGGQQYQPFRGKQTLDADYQLLNVKLGATASDIKRAYRRQMSQNHPDKLIAKGLPEEMIKLATEKTQKIQAAYDRIKAAKGF